MRGVEGRDREEGRVCLVLKSPLATPLGLLLIKRRGGQERVGREGEGREWVRSGRGGKGRGREVLEPAPYT